MHVGSPGMWIELYGCKVCPLCDHILYPLPQLLHPDANKRLQTADAMRIHPFFEELSWNEVQEKAITPSFIPPVSPNSQPTPRLMPPGMSLAKPHQL